MKYKKTKHNAFSVLQAYVLFINLEIAKGVRKVFIHEKIKLYDHIRAVEYKEKLTHPENLHLNSKIIFQYYKFLYAFKQKIIVGQQRKQL